MDLDNTAVFDEGLVYLFDALRENTTLRHLYLDSNGLTVESAKYMAKYFDYLVENDIKGVTSLWLAINRLDDKGITILANSLKEYKYLRRLTVSSNRLTHVGLKPLLDALVDHDNLIVLDCGMYKSTSDMKELPNNISDAGCDDIVDFIRRNKSVQFMSVEQNNITVDGLTKINEALQENDTMLQLLYDQYGLKVPQATRVAIKDKLKKNVEAKLGITYQDFTFIFNLSEVHQTFQ